MSAADDCMVWDDGAEAPGVSVDDVGLWFETDSAGTVLVDDRGFAELAP